MAARVTGIVLAGGAGRRMGTDKRLVLVDGEPMLRRVADAVASVADELLVVVAPERPIPAGLLDGVPARLALDRRADAGPLAGMEAGLLEASADHVLVVAGDLPWLDAGLLRALLARLDEAEAVAAEGRDGPEPLLAAYRRDPALDAATGLLDAGERRARALLDELSHVTVADTGASTRNVNEPADLLARPSR
jgi:molybdopterin-guanine dinucleotide biosynthesis protein A